ncbi:hypothetical protein ACFLRO_02030 [Bacteroidota bacterium]
MAPPVNVFRDVPDIARIFVIPTDRPLSSTEQDTISLRLSEFFAGWHAHGRKVSARSTIVHNRFIVVSAYVPDDQVSGCGIDASDHALEDISEVVGFSRAPVLDVFFELDGGVDNVSRPEFARLAQQGSVSKRTIVFDTSLSNAAQWKKGLFARPVSESWHARVFF